MPSSADALFTSIFGSTLVSTAHAFHKSSLEIFFQGSGRAKTQRFAGKRSKSHFRETISTIVGFSVPPSDTVRKCFTTVSQEKPSAPSSLRTRLVHCRQCSASVSQCDWPVLSEIESRTLQRKCDWSHDSQDAQHKIHNLLSAEVSDCK